MNVLDLFSGIGGFSLGLERAGMRTVAFCEIDRYARGVLAKHWPDVPCAEDITKRQFVAGEADVICGGFPCQDISAAGLGAGLAGERSGLWRELLRAIRVVRPKYAVVENVAALLARGMGTVLGDVASLGYDAEWHCIPASAVGAPHRRDRVWIIAADAAGGRHGCHGIGEALERQFDNSVSDVADAYCCIPARRLPQRTSAPQSRIGVGREDVANTDRQRKLQPQGSERDQRRRSCNGCEGLANAECIRCEQVVEPIASRTPGEGPTDPPQYSGLAGWRRWWATEPDVGRVAHGVPFRVDRLKGLGNAVVPQIPEIIGRAIMRANA